MLWHLTFRRGIGGVYLVAARADKRRTLRGEKIPPHVKEYACVEAPNGRTSLAHDFFEGPALPSTCDTSIKVRRESRLQVVVDAEIASPPPTARPIPATLQGRTMRWLAKELGCDPRAEAISRALYKGTDCGAYLYIDPAGRSWVGSIVEGSDWGTQYYDVTVRRGERWEYWRTRLREAIREVEDEARKIWEAANGEESRAEAEQYLRDAAGADCHSSDVEPRD